MAQNLSRNAKILVIVSSVQTYYIAQEHLRAGIPLSGLIDWLAIEDVQELHEKLVELDVDYIFYDRNPGGGIGVKI